MPKRVLVPLAAGFEELEAITLVDVLRRAGVEVLLAGTDGVAPYFGSRGVVVVPDVSLSRAKGPWDLIVLPGGLAGAQRLRDHEGLRKLLQEQVAQGALVGAICAAPMVLDAAGILSSEAFTCYPGVEEGFETRGRRDDAIVDAGHVITSQAPGTAMAFALHLVERLCGETVRSEVQNGLRFER